MKRISPFITGVLGILVGIIITTIYFNFQHLTITTAQTPEAEEYTVVMSSESRRGGLPVIVRHEILALKGSHIERLLLKKQYPVLGSLVDAPTDVVSLYLEKVNNGTLTEWDIAEFERKLNEYIQ